MLSARRLARRSGFGVTARRRLTRPAIRTCSGFVSFREFRGSEASQIRTFPYGGTGWFLVNCRQNMSAFAIKTVRKSPFKLFLKKMLTPKPISEKVSLHTATKN
jgi:hypothetical protein